MTDGLPCLVSYWILSNVPNFDNKKCESLGFPIFIKMFIKKRLSVNNLLAKIILIDIVFKNQSPKTKIKTKGFRCHQYRSLCNQLVTKCSFREILNESDAKCGQYKDSRIFKRKRLATPWGPWKLAFLEYFPTN